MSDQPDNLTHLLRPYGLIEEEAKIYLILIEKGYMTALSISRDLRMGRTKVYRILDKLIAKGLVDQKLDSTGLRFGATDPSKLNQIINDREHEVLSLKDSLPALIENLEKMSWRKHEKTKVLYYKGVEGLKQITYNSTLAKGELLTFETTNDMSEFLPQDFSEEIRQRLVNNKVFIKELTWNKEFKPYTKVSDLVTKHWETRFIDPQTFKMKTEALIYNDVYVIYNPSGEEKFAVEIYNADIADMQRQLFNIVWNQAKKLKIIDSSGRAILED